MKISNELEQKIIKTYNEGYSYVNTGKICNVNPSTVQRVLKRNNVHIRNNQEKSKIYYCDENYFEKIDTPEKAYWLGFIYADGYISITHNQYKFGISLAEKDCILLKKLNFFLKSSYPINTYKQTTGYSKDTIYCRLLISSQKIVEDLIKHGVVEHKTNVLQKPNIDKHLIPHFIRGYIDGDGCITCSERKDKTIAYKVKILGTESILDFIKAFIEENKIATINQYYKRQPDQTVSSIDFGGNEQVRNFLDLIYKDSTIHLERKYEKYLDLCRYNNFSRSKRKLLD